MMDARKSEDQLIQELAEARKRIAELEKYATECKLTEEALEISLRRFQVLSESTFEGVVLVEGRIITDINDQLLQLMGYSRNEAIGADILPFIHPDDLSKVLPGILASKEQITEHRMIRKDGSIIFVESHGKPLNIHGHRARITSIRDITERRRVEEERRNHHDKLEEMVKARTLELAEKNCQLEKEIAERKRVEGFFRESEALYRLLTTNANDIIFTMDLDLRFTFISPSVSRIRGFTVEEAMSQTISEALTPASREVAMSVLAEELDAEYKGSKDTSIARTVELEETCKDGSTIWTETTFSFLRDDKNILEGILGITRDISERKRAEEEKKKFEAQLAQAQRVEAIDRFAGGIAHDLNNILYPIIINLEELIDEEREGSYRHEILTQTLKAVYRQRDLVKKILSFSRRSERVNEPVRVRPLLEETLTFLRASLPSTISIQENIHVQTDVVMGDPIQIQQVIMNLCKNAADALESGKGTIEIGLTNVRMEPLYYLRDMKAGDYLKLTVKDTGMGMSPEVVDRVFEPFFTRKDIGKGTGMGLPVVHGIVKSHGGAVTVESEEGKGALFTVYLPISHEKPREEDANGESTPSVQGKESILLVDDEELILSSLQRTLNLSGYRVKALKNGQEALKEFSENPDEFDLVITDLTMPGMTGLELTRKIRSVRSDIPIVLCTGFNDVISQVEAKSFGIKELLLKPVGAGELKKVIQQALEQ